MSNEMTEVDARLIRETEMAFLIDDGSGEQVWIPKSLTVYDGGSTFTIPEWLAIEKGLV